MLALVALVVSHPSFGQTWTRTYPSPADDLLWKAVEAPDGSLYVSGYSNDVGSVLHRLEADGTPRWSRTITGSFSAAGAVLLDHDLASNGDVIGCGYDGYQGWVVRYDQDGQLLWQYQLPPYNGDMEEYWPPIFTSIIECANGDVLVVGEVRSTIEEYAYPIAFRFDAAGNELWRRGVGLADCTLTDVVELPNGTLASLGRLWGGPYLGQVLVRIAADGTVLGQFVMDPRYGTRSRIARAADGDLLIVAGWDFARPRHWIDPETPHVGEAYQLLKVTHTGNVVWRRSCGPVSDVAIDLVTTADGGAVVLGETASLGGDRDLRLTRFDAQGDVVWQRAYGGDGNEDALGLTPLANGGFVLAGRTGAGSPETFDGLLLVVDASGALDSCPSADTWTLPADLAGASTAIGVDSWTPSKDLVPQGPTVSSSGLPTLATCLGITPIGTTYCDPAVANSTGLPGELTVLGSQDLAASDVTLVGTSLPPAKFGYFLAGMGNGEVTPPGAQGKLCLAGATVHRYAQAVQVVDAGGVMSITIDVTAVPGHGAIQPGETWNFQGWFRDQNPTTTSNFTDAVGVSFQ